MIKRYLMIVPVIFLGASCNNNPRQDSEKVAEKSNERKADSSKVLNKIEDDSKFVVKATSGVTMETQLGSYAAKMPSHQA